MSDARNLWPDAFAGTAEAYVRHRPPYPRALLDALVAASAPQPPSALLDLASGPGRIALDLAAAFDRVVAVDLEPEMVETGKREATRRGIGNVAWSTMAAEMFTAETGMFDLVTIGEAFHRLDQRLIAAQALGWLKAGGCLATPGFDGIFAGERPWQAAAASVARRWMARAFPGGWAEARAGAATGPGAHERLLTAAGFVDAERRTFPAPLTWTMESIVGYFESTSVCSRRALGEHFAGFEDELKATLTPLADSGAFHETAYFDFTLARKPLA